MEAPAEETQVAARRRLSVNANTLLLFGLLAAVGGATYLMCLRASAETITENPAAQQAATTINTFLKGGAQNVRTMMVMLHETEKVVKQFDNYPSATQIPLSDLHTNPFLSLTGRSLPLSSLSDDAAKREAEEQQAAEKTLVAGLKLESMVVGAHSVCMINGKTYHEGEGTEKFRVDKITPQGVWVVVGSVRTEIKMAPPRID